jgi:glycosyltransferase involved in cell wall biosynthesis
MSTAAALRKGAVTEDRPEEALPATAAGGRRPHICFVSLYAWPVLSRDPNIQIVGGAEVQQAILARLFARSGYRVSMVTLDHGQPDPSVCDGVTVHKAFRKDAGIPVLRFVHPRMTGVWSAMRRADADIYYFRSSSMFAAVVAEFCRRYRRGFVYAGASDKDFVPGEEQISLTRDRMLFHHGVRSADAIVAQNATQVETCRANYGREAVLIPSCYDLPDASPARKSTFEKDLILWCGTVHQYKQPEILLDIAARLPQYRFVIVGGPSVDETATTSFYEGIRARAAMLPNVTMTGFLPLHQVEPWFDQAKVLALTSVYEGMPNVFMQAWARGIPTVATVDVGARLSGAPVYKTFSQTDEAVAEIQRLMEDCAYWARSSAGIAEYFAGTHSTAEILRRYGAVLDSVAPKKKAVA